MLGYISAPVSYNSNIVSDGTFKRHRIFATSLRTRMVGPYKKAIGHSYISYVNFDLGLSSKKAL